MTPENKPPLKLGLVISEVSAVFPGPRCIFFFTAKIRESISYYQPLHTLPSDWKASPCFLGLCRWLELLLRWWKCSANLGGRLSGTEDRPMMDPGDAPRMFVRRFLGAGDCLGPLLAGRLLTWVQAEEWFRSLWSDETCCGTNSPLPSWRGSKLEASATTGDLSGDSGSRLMGRFLELVAYSKITLTFRRASNAVWMPCISRDIGVSG